MIRPYRYIIIVLDIYNESIKESIMNEFRFLRKKKTIGQLILYKILKFILLSFSIFHLHHNPIFWFLLDTVRRLKQTLLNIISMVTQFSVLSQNRLVFLLISHLENYILFFIAYVTRFRSYICYIEELKYNFNVQIYHRF